MVNLLLSDRDHLLHSVWSLQTSNDQLLIEVQWICLANSLFWIPSSGCVRKPVGTSFKAKGCTAVRVDHCCACVAWVCSLQDVHIARRWQRWSWRDAQSFWNLFPAEKERAESLAAEAQGEKDFDNFVKDLSYSHSLRVCRFWGHSNWCDHCCLWTQGARILLGLVTWHLWKPSKLHNGLSCLESKFAWYGIR